jgi:hypothetical protein
VLFLLSKDNIKHRPQTNSHIWVIISFTYSLPVYIDTQALGHEDVWETGGKAPRILTATLDGCEW